MFGKEIAARKELKQAFMRDVLTPLVTQNKYKIDESTLDLFIVVNNKFFIEVHFNNELTQYVNICEVDVSIDGYAGPGKRISHFSLDKFFTPEMTVKVLHQVIVELENSYALVLSDN
jgi:hypothetical protein